MADVTVHGATKVAADITLLGITTAAKVHVVVAAYGGILETAVKRHASEPRTHVRPRGPQIEGPRLLTGGFVRTIGHRITRTLSSSTAEVGSSDPRALRLEHGFYGSDSLGRHYQQVPYPSFGPGLADIQRPFDVAIAAAVASGLR